MKIYANYVTCFDHYRADIIEDGMETEIIEENGDDLVETIKKMLGVDIEYDRSKRIFIIPEEYKDYEGKNILEENEEKETRR